MFESNYGTKLGIKELTRTILARHLTTISNSPIIHFMPRAEGDPSTVGDSVVEMARMLRYFHGRPLGSEIPDGPEERERLRKTIFGDRPIYTLHDMVMQTQYDPATNLGQMKIKWLKARGTIPENAEITKPFCLADYPLPKREEVEETPGETYDEVHARIAADDLFDDYTVSHSLEEVAPTQPGLFSRVVSSLMRKTTHVK